MYENMAHKKCLLRLGSESMLPKTTETGVCSGLIRNIRKLAQVSPSHPDVFHHIISYPAILNERQKQLMTGDRYLLHPFSLFSLYWKTFMVFINIVHMTISPFRVTFIYFEDITHIDVLDYVLLGTYSMCFLDVLINFCTGYVEDCHSIVMNRQKISCYYIRHWFVVDLITCLPISFILLYLKLNQKKYLLIAHLLPVLRTFKIYNTLRCLRTFLKIFTRSHIYIRLISYVIFTCILMHWATCFMYSAPTIAYYWLDKQSRYANFLKKEERFDFIKFSLYTRYLKAFFFSLSAFYATEFTSYRIVEPEEAIAMCLLILGFTCFTVYSTIFFLKIYMMVYDSNMRYCELMNEVERYMRHAQFTTQMKKRVRMLYNYMYDENYFNEERLLECLSEQLRHEINLHSCHNLITNVNLFADQPAKMVGTLLGCLKPEVYLTNDLIIRAGDTGDAMYFISSGTVAVYTIKGAEIRHLQDGDYFGEVALLMKDKKRVATVVAIEITKVYRLNYEDFKRHLLTHKVLYERIEILATKRMHETVLLDEAFGKETTLKRESYEQVKLKSHDVNNPDNDTRF